MCVAGRDNCAVLVVPRLHTLVAANALFQVGEVLRCGQVILHLGLSGACELAHQGLVVRFQLATDLRAARGSGLPLERGDIDFRFG